MPIITPKGTLNTIHVTDRRQFKTCRALYKYQIVERLAPIDSRVDALYIGTGCHHALSHYYIARMNGGFAHPVDFFNDWLYVKGERAKAKGKMFETPDEETLSMIHSILRNYMLQYEDVDAEWKILAVEQNMKAKIPGTNVTLSGTVDLIVKWKGYVWIVDHKFLRAIGERLHEQLEMDDQMTGYLWLAKQHGINARGCIYNVILKREPAIPEILKSGALSKNKAIYTNYDTYLKAILDNNLDPEDYVEILDLLASEPKKFFAREIVVRNGKELQAFEDDLTYEARDMTSKNTRLYPSPGQHCGWCGYRTLCTGERSGEDTAFTREHLYRLRENDER